MNREEVLEKSRRQKSDEGKDRAEEHGSHMGFVVMSFVGLFIIFFNNMVIGKTRAAMQVNFAVFAMYFGSWLMRDISMRKFYEKKKRLFSVIFDVVMLLSSLGIYIHAALHMA